jgi:hypothetical protein
MKVKLGLSQRLSGVLAELVSDQTGNHDKMVAIRKFKESLLLSESEVKESGFEEKISDDGRLSFRWKKHIEKEVEFKPCVLEAIKNKLEQLNGAGRLTEAQDMLYEKFVESMKKIESKKEPA